MRAVSRRQNGAGKVGGIGPDTLDLFSPDNRNTLGRKVQPRPLHLRQAAERALHGGDAGAAINIRHAEIGLAETLPQITACQHQLL